MPRLVPTGRSVLVALAIVAGAAGAYWTARTTSLFAVEQLDVAGAPPAVVARVERVLRPARGDSLLAVDLAAAERMLEAVPTVRSVSFDRAFPHTLRVRVVPERAVAVVRQGASAWLLSAHGRVMRSLARRVRRGLPRIWLAKGVRLEPGTTVAGDAAVAVAALAQVRRMRLPGRVAAVRASDAELTFRLRSGLEIRLGDPSNARLKLAIAARVFRLARDAAYIDVSVVDRPVSSATLDSQVEVESVAQPDLEVGIDNADEETVP